MSGSSLIIGRKRAEAARQALDVKMERRRVLISELVELEAELLTAGAIVRRSVHSRRIIHGRDPSRQPGGRR